MVEDKITTYLYRVGLCLLDVEDDTPWDEYSLSVFAIEWAVVCGMVKWLSKHYTEMNSVQQKAWCELTERFARVSERLKELELENPLDG